MGRAPKVLWTGVVRGLEVAVLWEPRDLWVGVFWDPRPAGLYVYVVPFPTCVLRVVRPA